MAKKRVAFYIHRGDINAGDRAEKLEMIQSYKLERNNLH